jgi:hypothetical protein
LVARKIRTATLCDEWPICRRLGEIPVPPRSAGGSTLYWLRPSTADQRCLDLADTADGLSYTAYRCQVDDGTWDDHLWIFS